MKRLKTPLLLLKYWLLAGCVLAEYGLAQTELYRLDGASAGDHLGTSVAVISDLDGDGAREFVVGAPGAAGAGQVYVVSGQTGTVLHTLTGTNPGDRFGHSLAEIGDIDADGFLDWIVGAPQRYHQPSENFGPAFGPGYAVVYSGQTNVPLQTHTGPGGSGAFGLCVAGGGLLGNDAVPDYLVVESLESKVHVFSGASLTLTRTDQYPASTFSVAVVGDLDGNGKDDYAVAWIEYTAFYTGEVWAMRGGNGAVIWKDKSSPYAAEYGYSVIGPGDLDGDTVPDVVGGALEDSRFVFASAGYVQALSGAGGGVLFKDKGGFGGYLSAAMVPMGDLDGDGVPEFAAGQPGQDGYSQETRLYSGTSKTPVAQVNPDGASIDAFGSALAAGDVNGDGLVDLLIGARLDDDAGLDSGSLTVVTLVLAPTAYCSAQVNSQGCTPTTWATGTPSLTANNFRVRAAGVLNNKSGLLFFGASPKQVPFGGGFKCVAPPTVRTPIQQSSGNPPPDDCSGTFAFHFNKAYLSSKGLGAGDALFCQYWSRDPAAASNTNLTDALAFELLP